MILYYLLIRDKIIRYHLYIWINIGAIQKPKNPLFDRSITVLYETGVSSAWRDWYRCCHEDRFSQSQGTAFENYASEALGVVHSPDFINPTPKGSLGDFGCDGITGDGGIAYACFGYLPNRAKEKALAEIVKGKGILYEPAAVDACIKLFQENNFSFKE